MPNDEVREAGLVDEGCDEGREDADVVELKSAAIELNTELMASATIGVATLLVVLGPSFLI